MANIIAKTGCSLYARLYSKYIVFIKSLSLCNYFMEIGTIFSSNSPHINIKWVLRAIWQCHTLPVH